MIEYPSIINSSKAPREQCIAFDKLDGSNFRAKFTQKRGFDVFGTRTQLIDETTSFWNEMVLIFKRDLQKPLEELFKKDKEFRDFREIIVYGEFLGDDSFAGNHDPNQLHKIVIFDVLTGHKDRKFVNPREFTKTFSNIVETPKVVYEGNLNDEFISNVRNNIYGLKEGVICKGTTRRGDYRGGIWSCKIKTNEYIAKLKDRFADDWIKYGE